MKYVKFISKPNEWFKEGSEAFYQDDSFKSRRMTIEEYDRLLETPPYPAAVFVGIRVCEDNPNERNFSEPEEERIDGEFCCFTEFDIEFTDEYKEEYN
jgi:hypothetical protein